MSILGPHNSFHITTSHIQEIHPNIIHPSTPRSPQWSLSLRLPHQDSLHPVSSPIRATCTYSILSPAHYWVRSTNLLDSPYAISSTPPSLRPPRSKYSPQHHVLKHHQIPFLPQCRRPSFWLYLTHIIKYIFIK